MTAETDVLPLVGTLRALPEHVQRVVQSYARANVAHAVAPLQAEIEALRAEVERLNVELSRLEVIAGYGGVSSDAPERLILASEVYDGIQSCDKWRDVRRVVDDGQPMPESATAYVRADRAERLEEALREATAMLLADYPETAKRLRAALGQDKGSGYWPEMPKNGGPDWTGFDG